MKKNVIKILLFLICVASISLSAGCSKADNYDNMVKVVFELEGGTYSNSTMPITYYYNFEKGTENLIKELGDKSLSSSTGKKTVTNGTMFLEGWYRTRTEEGEGENKEVTYSGKWNFATDKVTDAGITLYARWVKYVYRICYNDEETGEAVKNDEWVYPVIGTDGKLSDTRASSVAEARIGYTMIPGYYDEEGNDWNMDFVHPQDDKNPIVDVFVKYVKNLNDTPWVMVGTASDFKEKFESRFNIYLLNDIDFKGMTIDGFKNNLYDAVIYGNGHTIKNFSVKSDINNNSARDDMDFGNRLVFVSLFGKAENAIVKDITIENVTYTFSSSYRTGIKGVILAPMFLSAENSEFTNVTFSGKCVVKEMHADVHKNFVTTKNAVYLNKGNVTETNVTVNFTVEDLTAGA